jgi:hypothetical protein
MSALTSETHRTKIIFSSICAILLFAAGWFVQTFEFTSWDFRNELWAPSHLLWRGESPYNTTIIFPVSLAVWFPQIIGLFFPLGLLTEHQAANTWLLFNTGLLVYLTWRLMTQAGGGKPGVSYFSIILVLVFLFPPTYRLIKLGQVDILIMTAIILGTRQLEQRRYLPGAFFYLLALAKPQLAVVCLPSLIGYWLFVKRDPVGVAKFALSACFSFLALTLPLWLAYPKWYVDFISNLSANPSWAHPSIFFQLRSALGTTGVVLWSVLFLSALAISLFLWRQKGPSYAVPWSLALTTLVSPYIWSWDFTLLLPLLIDTAVRIKGRLGRVVLLGFHLLAIVLTIFSLSNPRSSGDDSLWWFPVLMLTGVISSLLLSRAATNQQGW